MGNKERRRRGGKIFLKRIGYLPTTAKKLKEAGIMSVMELA
ncbi:MAG: hypothetical protein WBL67_21740 [Nitrososphaeraceae archaeon]